ncbi:MAG: hypothetical protein ACR65X_10910 [Methylocystis sp.]
MIAVAAAATALQDLTRQRVDPKREKQGEEQKRGADEPGREPDEKPDSQPDHENGQSYYRESGAHLNQLVIFRCGNISAAAAAIYTF